MKVTYFGHSCFLVNAGGKNILFDPFITPNELAKDIEVDQIQADYDTLSLIVMDHYKATQSFTGAGLNLYLPPIGSTIDL